MGAGRLNVLGDCRLNVVGAGGAVRLYVLGTVWLYVLGDCRLNVVGAGGTVRL